MPLYDINCPRCGELIDVFMHIDETDLPHCPNCYKPVKILIRPPHLSIFKPQWFEHIDNEPQYVESKKQLRQICDKNDLTCYYSIDGERGPDVKEV